MLPTLAPAGASSHAPARSAIPSIVAQYQLNPFESFVATLTERSDGRRVCAISRIKQTVGGVRRMDTFEFGEHRAIAVASLLDELLRAIANRSMP